MRVQAVWKPADEAGFDQRYFILQAHQGGLTRTLLVILIPGWETCPSPTATRMGWQVKSSFVPSRMRGKSWVLIAHTVTILMCLPRHSVNAAWAKLDDWRDMGLVGQVHSFTLLYVNLDGSPKSEPEIIAFVRMGDGGLIHRLGNISIEDISIGMHVKAIFRPQSERQGSILDINFFEPVEA